MSVITPAVQRLARNKNVAGARLRVFDMSEPPIRQERMWAKICRGLSIAISHFAASAICKEH